MTLKSATFLAAIGTLIVAALQIWRLIFNALNVLRGLIPAAALFSSVLYAFGALTVTVFFFSFYRTQ